MPHINSTIVRVRERGELLRESRRVAVRNGGFKMAWIGPVEPGATKAAPLAWEGLDDGYLEEMGLTLANRAEDPGPVGEALRTKKMLVVNDIENSCLSTIINLAKALRITAGRRYFPAAAAAAVSALRRYRARARRFRLTALKAAASLELRTPGYFYCSAIKSALQSHPGDSSDL